MEGTMVFFFEKETAQWMGMFPYNIYKQMSMQTQRTATILQL